MRRISHATLQPVQTYSVESLRWPVREAYSAALSPAPCQPPTEPFINISINVIELIIGIACAKIVPPTPQDGIQGPNQSLDILNPTTASLREFMHSLSDALHCFWRWPSLHEVAVRHPLDTTTLTNGAAQKLK